MENNSATKSDFNCPHCSKGINVEEHQLWQLYDDQMEHEIECPYCDKDIEVTPKATWNFLSSKLYDNKSVDSVDVIKCPSCSKQIDVEENDLFYVHEEHIRHEVECPHCSEFFDVKSHATWSYEVDNSMPTACKECGSDNIIKSSKAGYTNDGDERVLTEYKCGSCGAYCGCSHTDGTGCTIK